MKLANVSLCVDTSLAYLSDVPLHHADRIDQDVSGKPLNLLSKSGTK